MSKRHPSKTPKTPSSEKSYSPKALALAERAADKVLDPIHLHTRLVESNGGGALEWMALADELGRTTLAYIADHDDRREAAYTEATFLAGIAIGRRIGGAR